MPIDVLDESAYQALVEGGEPIKRMPAGVKVWRLPDGRVVKLFRPRGRFSRSRFRPASVRFAANAETLHRLGFTSVVVDQLIYVPTISCHGVVYQGLIGAPLEAVLSDDPAPEVFEQLAALMADLHRAGVLFRALHLGNLLLLPDGALALIDVEELSVSRRALGVAGRLRNFRHLLRRFEDRAVIGQRGFSELSRRYLQHAALSPRHQATLRRKLAQLEEQIHWPQSAD